MADQIITPEGLQAFLVAETTQGEAKVPAATDAIPLRPGLSFPTQPNAFSTIAEALNTRGVTGLMRDLRKAGTVKVPTLFRPSGAAGTAPMEAALWEALLGLETVVAATSVTYTETVAKARYTLWILAGNLQVFCEGLAVHGMTVKGSQNGVPELDFEGSFRRLGWAGESPLNGGLVGGETDVVVDDSDQFAVGAYITIGDSTGHQVTAIATATHTLTVTPAVVGAQADNELVTPYLPTPTMVGDPLDYRPAVEIDAVAVNYMEWEMSVTEPIAWVEEVPADPTTADYPSDFVARSGREVKGSVKAVVRTADAGKLKAADTDGSLTIDFASGSAGSRVKLAQPQGRWNVPNFDSGDPTVELTLEFTAKQTSALEDEISVSYT